MSSRPLQRALVTIASSSPARKPFPGSQQEATEALCHSEQVWTFLGKVSVGASPWLAAAWRWWSAQPFGSLLRAWTRASFQRTAVSPWPMLPWILLLFYGGGGQFPLHRPGLAWLLCVQGVLWSPDPAREDGSRLAQQQQEGSALWRRLGLPAGDGWRHGASSFGGTDYSLPRTSSPLSLCLSSPSLNHCVLVLTQSLFTAGVRFAPQSHQLCSTKF